MDRSEKLTNAWEFYDKKEYRSAFEATLPMLPQLSGVDLRDAWRLMGLACLGQRLCADAVHWLSRACESNEESDDWYHLATAAALQGNAKLAEEAFEQVRLIQRTARYGQGMGFYLQLFGYASALCDARAHDRVLPLLDELASAYRRVGSTDTSLLYTVGLPFLASFLFLAVTHFAAADLREEGEAWLSQFARGMDVETQRRVARAMVQLRGQAEADGS